MPKRRVSKTVDTHFNKEFFFYQLVPSFLRLLVGTTNFKSIATKLGFQKLSPANVVIQYKMKNTSCYTAQFIYRLKEHLTKKPSHFGKGK